MLNFAPNTQKYHIEDVNRAGGILSIMGELEKQGLVNINVSRVDNLNLGEAIEKYSLSSSNVSQQAKELWSSAPAGKFNLVLGSQDCKFDTLDTDRKDGCIRDFDNAYVKDGGLAVLIGNIAKDGCVVKTAGVDPSIFKFKGPARVFESQDDACEGILKGIVNSGDVVVMIFEGPNG